MKRDKTKKCKKKTANVAKKDVMEKRYERNLIFTDEEQHELAEKTVFIAGCGGLGGYCCEMLARAGAGKLIVCDGDVFDRSNLNRQLGATEQNLGKNKAEEIKKRINLINSQIQVCALPEFISPYRTDMLTGADVVIDALDTAEGKLMLQSLCRETGTVMIHGGISGWQGQVCTVMPGDDTLCNIYQSFEERETASPSFTPAVAAGLQVSLAIKFMLKKGTAARKNVLFFDLLEDSWYEVNMVGASINEASAEGMPAEGTSAESAVDESAVAEGSSAEGESIRGVRSKDVPVKAAHAEATPAKDSVAEEKHIKGALTKYEHGKAVPKESGKAGSSAESGKAGSSAKSGKNSGCKAGGSAKSGEDSSEESGKDSVCKGGVYKGTAHKESGKAVPKESGEDHE